MGFSSGLTTGVWMGRDDARPVKGLQGGTAHAGSFAAFMKVAVAKCPIEQVDTEETLPEWQLEPDEEVYFGRPDEGAFVDADGNPIEQPGEGPDILELERDAVRVERGGDAPKGPADLMPQEDRPNP